MAVIAIVSLSTNHADDDPKGISLTNKIFLTKPAFNIEAYAILIIIVVLFSVF